MTPDDPEREPFQWDFTTVLIVLLVVAFLMLLSFELWSPHFFPHRR